MNVEPFLNTLAIDATTYTVIPAITMAVVAIITFIRSSKDAALEKRTNAAKDELLDFARDAIERGGGKIVNVTFGVTLLHRKAVIREHSTAWRFEVEYADQRGFWHFFLLGDQPVDWIWSDPESKSDKPPIAAKGIVDHKLRSLTSKQTIGYTFFILGIIAAGVAAIWAVDYFFN